MTVCIGLVVLCMCAEGGIETPPPTTMPVPTTTPVQKIHVAAEISTWLRENAIPFDTAEPGSSFYDLMPLKEIIGDARIVALGEATHGTHEFFQMKHRILEFLVKEMDFNVFVMEDNWSECNLINDYVHTGQGDPAELLKRLKYRSRNAQEVLNMILWMRDHNENPGDAPLVSFFGFDMSDPTMAMDNVIEYLQKVDPEAVAYVDSLYVPFHPYMTDYQSRLDYYKTPQSVKNLCRENVQEVYDFLSSRQTAYEKASSPKEFAFTLQSARICVQAEDMYSGDYGARDQYMAENVVWLLNQVDPNAKIILWAHNYHVGVNFTYGTSMGAYLREQYDDEMVIFGFMFYSGSFNAFTMNKPSQRNLTVHHVEPPPENSYEYYFHSTAMLRLFLDLRGIQPGSPATDWLVEPHSFRSIGKGYDESNPLLFFQVAALPQVFDVIIYFQDTSPSVLWRYD